MATTPVKPATWQIHPYAQSAHSFQTVSININKSKDHQQWKSKTSRSKEKCREKYIIISILREIRVLKFIKQEQDNKKNSSMKKPEIEEIEDFRRKPRGTISKQSNRFSREKTENINYKRRNRKNFPDWRTQVSAECVYTVPNNVKYIYKAIHIRSYHYKISEHQW